MATAPIGAISTNKLKDLLKCSICLETVIEPRTLPCFHSYCKNCLERFVETQRNEGPELKCADCRTKFTLSEGGVEGMKGNHFILSMLDLMAIQNQIPCTPCSHNCDEPAVGRCVKCEKFMCTACLDTHNNYKGFCDHLVLSMGEVSKPENKEKIKGTPLCGKHKSEELKLYCEKCEEIICRDCKDSGSHPSPEHNCLLLETVVEREKASLSTDIKTLDQMLTNENERLQEMYKYSRSLEDDIRATEEGFNNTKKKILRGIEQTLNEKCQPFIDDARMTYDKRRKKTDEGIEQIKLYTHKVSGTADMSKYLLENGNKAEIVSIQKDIKRNVQTLQNENLKSECDTQKNMAYNFDEIEAILIQEISTKLEYDIQVCFQSPADAPKTVPEKTGQIVFTEKNSKEELKKGQAQDEHGTAQPVCQMSPSGFYPMGQRFPMYPAQVVQTNFPTPVRGQPFVYLIPMGHQGVQCPSTHPTGHTQQQSMVAGSRSKSTQLVSKRKSARPRANKNKPAARAGFQVAGNANHGISIPGQDVLNPSALASASDQKQMLGERIFPLIQQTYPDLAGKITGMLLEIDNSELLHMLEYRDALNAKVKEAVSVLHAHKAREAK